MRERSNVSLSVTEAIMASLRYRNLFDNQLDCRRRPSPAPEHTVMGDACPSQGHRSHRLIPQLVGKSGRRGRIAY